MQSSVLQSKKPIRTIEDLRTFVLNSISNVDINLQLPPYISTFFHPLRLKVFQNYSPLQESDPEQRKQILYEFVQVLDEEMINLFEMQLSKPYQDLIFSKHYCIPRDFDVPALQGDNKTMIALTTLVGSIAEWNIQIERTVDSFSRVQLYQLWTPDQKVKEIQLNAELKSILSPDNDFNYSNFSKHILLNTLSYGSKKFGDYLSSAGLSQANLSFGAVLLLYHAFVGGAAIPWKVLIPQQNLTWLVGGMLGSFTLGKISTYLDKYDKIEQLYGFAKVFEEITKHLLYFNESINTAVNKCLLSVSKQEELNMRNELKYILEDFLKEPEQIKTGGVEIITVEDILKKENDQLYII